MVEENSNTIELQEIPSSETSEETPELKKSLQVKLINKLHHSSSEIAKSGITILVSSETFPFSKKYKNYFDYLLLIVFLANFAFSTVLFAIKQQHVAYNTACIVVSATGMLKKFIKPIVHRSIKFWRAHHSTPQHDDNQHNVTGLRQDIERQAGIQSTAPQEIGQVGTRIDQKREKNTVTKCVLGLLDEALIYSSMICALYGFIDERGWNFDRAFAEVDFALLLINIIRSDLYKSLLLDRFDKNS